MRTRHFADTNTGLRRQHNEDAYLADEKLELFLVCDGVGGRARGEGASAEAADLVWEWMKREEPLLRSACAESTEGPDAATPADLQLLRKTVHRERPDRSIVNS